MGHTRRIENLLDFLNYIENSLMMLKTPKNDKEKEQYISSVESIENQLNHCPYPLDTQYTKFYRKISIMIKEAKKGAPINDILGL